MLKNKTIMVGDFETTVYSGQVNTEVWASALVELFTENVKLFGSIDDTFDYLVSLKSNVIIYYHNLKFDGEFWLSYLLTVLKFKQASIQRSDRYNDIVWIDDKDMQSKTFKYAISDMGQWYFIKIKIGKYIIEIRDSLKLLPFSVKRIGESFGTKHKKREIEYKGIRYANCNITDEEKEYIENDVLVVKEALEIMFTENHTKLTIGACCLSEYKNIIGADEYKGIFPQLYDMPIDLEQYGCENVGEYIRKSYRGGWCYLVPQKANKILTNGFTADVNSLYPSMMSSESGNRYPYGKPTFWVGEIPQKLQNKSYYWFVRLRTRFYLKKGYLPFIQIKANPLYPSTECLTTSDIYDKQSNQYFDHYYIGEERHEAIVEMTMTCTDYILFREHYNVKDFEILDGCYFSSEIGLFDEYINKHKKIKLESKGARRELAKLFLNNLYGKMASNTNSSFKYAYIKDDGALGFFPVIEHEKIAGYIAVGSAITSYSRNFTIRAAQQNFHGANKGGFCYADTDSIHCDMPIENVKGISVHDKNFCCWKLEAQWDIGYFVRQKTYIEHVHTKDGERIEKPYYDIKCAGLPSRCKKLFELSLEKYDPTNDTNYNEEEKQFILKHYSIQDFSYGLVIPSKLLPKRIKGGVVLCDTEYQLRK